MSKPLSLAERFGPYDETAMIGYTVIRYQRNLLTDDEYATWLAFIARAKAETYGKPEVERRARELWGNDGDVQIERALAQGYAAFRAGVATRLMQQRPSDLSLNRCPSCQKIVLTPQARWCFWCQQDWH